MTTDPRHRTTNRSPNPRDVRRAGRVERREEWSCPVCERPTPQVRRAGRPRIYCTNACRQRAFRWRRAYRVRAIATPNAPLSRGHVGLRTHALRDQRDFVSKLADRRNREVSVCGAMVRPARLNDWWHYDFRLDIRMACRSCIQLVRPPGEQPSGVKPSSPGMS